MSDIQTAFRLAGVSEDTETPRVRIADESPPLARPNVELLTKGFVGGYTVESWWRGRWQNSLHLSFEPDRERPYSPLDHAPESITVDDSQAKLVDTSPKGSTFDAATASITLTPHEEGYTVCLRVESATGPSRESTRILPLYSPNHPDQSEQYYRLSKQ
jgi:hypothetical protein